MKAAIVRFFLFAALAAMAATRPAGAMAAPLRIGVSLPLSGNSALLSKQFMAGARVAIENFAGGGEIELMEADDGCDPDLAQLAAQDLEAAGVAIVTGFLCANAAAAAAAELKDSGIPVVVAGARADYLLGEAERNDWNLWRMAPGENYGSDAAFRILSERWRGIPWAVVDDGTIYGRTLSDQLRASMEEAGQPPQLVDTIRPAQSNQVAFVRRLKQAAIGAVFIATGAEDAATIWREIALQEMEIEVVGGEALDQLPWLEAAAGLPEGLFAITEPAPSQLPDYEKLAEILRRAEVEPGRYAVLGFAAMELAVAAIRPTPAGTTAALSSTVFRTVLGNIDFDARRANHVNRYSLFVWRGGAFVPAEGPQN